MAGRLEKLLDKRARETFVGRERELAALLRSLDGDGPLIVHVHGIPGVGKSTLLARFGAEARDRGATVLAFDCRLMEPTPAGFLRELGTKLERQLADLEQGIRAIEDLPAPVVVMLDAYELFRLMDTWLRQILVPSLPESARLVLASREPPQSRWLTGLEWQGLFRGLLLETLSDDEARELLTRAGVGGTQLERLNEIAHGHPLALRMGAALAVESAGIDPGATTLESLLREMTRLFLEDIGEHEVREWLLAASVVRRVTETLLAALCPEADAGAAYEHLCRLPFMVESRDGLRLHEAVRDAISGSLRASNPERHRRYRALAWHRLREAASDANPAELWRYTADMLYLIENPVVREAFFPSGSRPLAVEPALGSDWPRLVEISEAHDGVAGREVLEYWWLRLPEAFHMVRDEAGAVAGFYCMFEAAAARGCGPTDDPVTWQWLRHLQQAPVHRSERVLFLRRWLGSGAGEGPSAEQGACWLDVKRSYMEMRPRLRRVYLTLRNLTPYAPVATELGFRPLTGSAAAVGESEYHTAMLDFGPRSVDGWLGRLAAEELGISPTDILDRDGRALTIEGRKVSLTPLEYKLIAYLCEAEDRVASRAELLEHVWGHTYLGGSNVVDAVVRSLRKKMGQESKRIETVRGFGYRYHPD